MQKWVILYSLMGLNQSMSTHESIALDVGILKSTVRKNAVGSAQQTEDMSEATVRM